MTNSRFYAFLAVVLPTAALLVLGEPSVLVPRVAAAVAQMAAFGAATVSLAVVSFCVVSAADRAARNAFRAARHGTVGERGGQA